MYTIKTFIRILYTTQPCAQCNDEIMKDTNNKLHIRKIYTIVSNFYIFSVI